MVNRCFGLAFSAMANGQERHSPIGHGDSMNKVNYGLALLAPESFQLKS
jgi:hypothetical protein